MPQLKIAVLFLHLEEEQKNYKPHNVDTLVSSSQRKVITILNRINLAFKKWYSCAKKKGNTLVDKLCTRLQKFVHY